MVERLASASFIKTYINLCVLISIQTIKPVKKSLLQGLVHNWRSNQWPQIAELKLYNWANSSDRTQVMLNQLVMVIARLIKLNVSCELYLYSLQRTRSPPGPHLPKKIRNTHLHDYYDLKGKDIDVYFSFSFFFFFLSRGIILWIELPWPENPAMVIQFTI